MGSLAIQRSLRRQRRRVAVLVVVASLGGAVALAHSAGMDMHVPEALGWCLAVLPVAAAAAVVATSPPVLLRGGPRLLTAGAGAPAPAPPSPRARAGPTRSVVLRR